jgi:PAS domain-containing protein
MTSRLGKLLMQYCLLHVTLTGKRHAAQTEWHPMISEQQERLQESDSAEQLTALNRAILDTALDCIITMDASGRVREFNPAAERVFGFRREETIGQELAELIIPPALRERHRRGLAHYLKTGVGPV